MNYWLRVSVTHCISDVQCHVKDKKLQALKHDFKTINIPETE